MLRDDFATKLRDTPIHLVHEGKYYLVGEQHDDKSTWTNAMTNWAHVPKMVERDRTLVKEPDDPTGTFVTPGSEMLKPLD